MRTSFYFAAAITLSLGLTGCISKDLRALSSTENSAPILVVADRGASQLAPENTFASFDKAQELGARSILLDVQLSKDLKPVIFRDETLDEKTQLTGSIASRTSAELSRADLAPWFSRMKSQSVAATKEAAVETSKKSATTGSAAVTERSAKPRRQSARARRQAQARMKAAANRSLTNLPALNQVFERYGLTFQYIIVLHGNSDALIKSVLTTIREYGVGSNVTLASSDYELLFKIKGTDAAVAVSYLIDEAKTPNVEAEIQRSVVSKFDQIGLRASLVTSDYVKRAKTVKIAVLAFDSQNDEDIARAARSGAALVSAQSPTEAQVVISNALKIRY